MKDPVNLSLPPNTASNQLTIKSKVVDGLPKLVVEKVSDKEDSLDVVFDEYSLFEEETEDSIDEEESFNSDIFDNADHSRSFMHFIN